MAKFQGNLFTYLFGPQVKLRAHKFEPFASLLFGGAHTNVYGNAFTQLCQPPIITRPPEIQLHRKVVDALTILRDLAGDLIWNWAGAPACSKDNLSDQECDDHRRHGGHHSRKHEAVVQNVFADTGGTSLVKRDCG
jgi:hypothetical protein